MAGLSFGVFSQFYQCFHYKTQYNKIPFPECPALHLTLKKKKKIPLQQFTNATWQQQKRNLILLFGICNIPFHLVILKFSKLEDVIRNFMTICAAKSIFVPQSHSCTDAAMRCSFLVQIFKRHFLFKKDAVSVLISVLGEPKRWQQCDGGRD